MPYNVGLFTNAAGANIPADEDVVDTIGYSIPGIGAARYTFADEVAVTRSGLTAAGSPLVPGLERADDLSVGATVSGTGIPADAMIVAVDPKNRMITLSAAAAANGRNYGVPLTIVTPLNGTYVSAHPRLAFLAADGRGFQLNPVDITPYMVGVVDDLATDQVEALQEFFDFRWQTGATCDVTCEAGISTTLVVNSALTGTTPLTQIDGHLTLAALDAMSEMVLVRNLSHRVWDGGIQVTGTGAQTFASRTCDIGVRLFNVGGMVFTGGIYAQSFAHSGVAVTSGSGQGENNDGCRLGSIRALNCGSGQPKGGSLTANWSLPVNSGQAGSALQRTKLTLAGVAGQEPLYPASLPYSVAGSGPVQVRINNYLYYVYAVDRVANTIDIYPWLDPSAGKTGKLDWVLGGALFLIGNDSNVVGYSALAASQCGRVVMAACLYGPIGDQLITEACGTAVAIGVKPDSYCLGSSLNGLYLEGTTEHVAVLARSSKYNYHYIRSDYGLDPAKCWALGDPRGSKGEIIGGLLGMSGVSPTGVTLSDGGRTLFFEKPNQSSAVTPTVNFVDHNRPHAIRVIRCDSQTVALSAGVESAYNRLFGFSGATWRYVGTGPNGAPTGTFTFVAPQHGSVNGGPTVSFTGFDGPVDFSIEQSDANQITWSVYPVSGWSVEGIAGAETHGDGDVILTALSKKTQRFDTALTAHRTCTLPAPGQNGRRFRVLRSAAATGAFEVAVQTSSGAPLKVLSGAGQWCDVEDDGTEYALAAAGTL